MDARDAEITRLNERLRRQHREAARLQRNLQEKNRRLRRATANLQQQLEARDGQAIAELRRRVESQAAAVELYFGRWQRVLHAYLALRKRKSLRHAESRAVACALQLAAEAGLHKGDLQVHE